MSVKKINSPEFEDAIKSGVAVDLLNTHDKISFYLFA